MLKKPRTRYVSIFQYHDRRQEGSVRTVFGLTYATKNVCDLVSILLRAHVQSGKGGYLRVGDNALGLGNVAKPLIDNLRSCTHGGLSRRSLAGKPVEGAG